MPDYSHSKIYKLVDNTNGNIYIGSTTQSLSRRLAGHTANYRQFLDNKQGKTTSFDILKNGDYVIILLEEVNCQSKEQLLAIERRHIESTCCVNKQHPTRSKAEYYQDNKEIIKVKTKEYAEEHKDKISEYQVLYRQTNKAKNRAYQREYHREYRRMKKESHNSKEQQI